MSNVECRSEIQKLEIIELYLLLHWLFCGLIFNIIAAKLNMASKDMAILLGISLDSLRVSRYRLKKKLNLEQDESLTGFVQSL